MEQQAYCRKRGGGDNSNARAPVMTILSNPTFIVDVLSRDRQIVTRSQELRIRRTFRFLDLPPELRNMIYEHCLSFAGVNHFFNTYYADLKKARTTRNVEPPKHRRTTPAILLLNRQVHAEAVVLLRKKRVEFTHGLLDIKGVTELVSADVLRNLGAITVSVKGHPILHKHFIVESWTGYLDLLSDLEGILSKGHKLKKLVLDFEDKELAVHMQGCWHADNRCDFRDNLKEALEKLRAVRGVGCVEIVGIDEVFARKLKARMESKPLSFLDLPGEIRNAVYKYAGDYSHISTQIRKTMDTWHDHTTPFSFPPLTTPTIFLLNKQIAAEASSIVYTTPLSLHFPKEHTRQKQDEIPCITHFVSAATLQKIQHLDIDVGGWEWMHSLEHVLPKLARKHALRSFRLSFSDSLKSVFLASKTVNYPDRILQMNLRALLRIRGVPSVVIEGDLPEVFSRPLAQIMRTPADITELPNLRAIRGDGTVVEADEIDG